MGRRRSAGDRHEARYVPPPTDVLDPETGAGQPNFCYGYMAQAVEVSVDIETGHLCASIESYRPTTSDVRSTPS